MRAGILIAAALLVSLSVVPFVGSEPAGSSSYHEVTLRQDPDGYGSIVHTSGGLTELFENSVHVSGNNSYGRLGDGTTNNTVHMSELDMEDVARIFPTSETIYFLTSDGRLYGSGHNDVGQLGTADTSDRSTPVRIGEGLGTVVEVSCSPYDVFFMNSEGQLYGCGGNSSGRFGDGTTVNHLTPVRVAESFGTIDKFCIVDRTLYILTGDGELYGAGLNSYGILGTVTTNQTTFVRMGEDCGNITDFRISANTVLFLNEDGELYGQGRNDWGQLGTGDTVTPIKSPVRIGEGLGKVSSMECTYGATYILLDNGDVYACGGNGSGQLATGDTDNVLTPIRLGGELGKTFSKVEVAYKRTALLSTDGCLYVAGQNVNGQNGLGNAVNVPAFQQVTGYGTIADVFCSEQTTFIINDQGQIYGAGKNQNGILGFGNSNQVVRTFTEIEYDDEILSFDCDSNGVYLITTRSLGEHIVVPHGAAVSADGTTVTIGEHVFTAVPATDTAANTFRFDHWNAIPETVTSDLVLSATFSALPRGFSASYADVYAVSGSDVSSPIEIEGAGPFTFVLTGCTFGTATVGADGTVSYHAGQTAVTKVSEITVRVSNGTNSEDVSFSVTVVQVLEFTDTPENGVIEVIS